MEILKLARSYRWKCCQQLEGSRQCSRLCCGEAGADRQEASIETWNEEQLRKELMAAYDECERAGWRRKTLEACPSSEKGGFYGTSAAFAATVASNSYASVESTETAKAMSSQPAGILCSHLDGKGPCVDDQWTGVRDDCPMPGKFGQEGESNGPCEADGSVDGKVGVPKAFAHMLQTKEEPKSPAVAMASEPTTREWAEAEWRGGGWWQDGGWSAADGSWPHDGEEAADDGIWAADGEEAADHGVWAADGDGWWTTAAAWWDPEMEKKRFPPLVPLEWTGTGMVPSKKAATVSNGPETMGVGASAVVAYT